jgi:UDP-N-acetyl-D-glucosamine dehydrogenase
MHQTLIKKFQTGRARVAVIGLGYVGLPLALNFAKVGYQVVGIDLDARKVTAIQRGESYIGDISSGELSQYVFAEQQQASFGSNGHAVATHKSDVTLNSHYGLREGGSLSATTDYAVLAECDAVSICVPTPLSKTGDPDMSYIVSVTEQIVRYLHPGMVIVLESTTYPGTTRELLLPRLLENDLSLEVGKDFFLAFSPERIDPGRTDWMTHNTPKVMGGVTPACLAVATAYYGKAIERLIPVSSPDAAEMVKLFENTFRSVNIGLANELLLMCNKLGLDAWEVINAAATKPFGFMKFTPGPGLGGHCIPIDPQYLSWKLRTLAYNARFIELANEVNTEMPHYWVQQVQDGLNNMGRAVKGSRILVLGVAYKKNVNDMRESPALDIIHLLEEKGAYVEYHDPHIPMFRHDEMEMTCVDDLVAALNSADCVVITTDHDAYDWNQIVESASLLVDTRHAAFRIGAELRVQDAV